MKKVFSLFLLSLLVLSGCQTSSSGETSSSLSESPSSSEAPSSVSESSELPSSEEPLLPAGEYAYVNGVDSKYVMYQEAIYDTELDAPVASALQSFKKTIQNGVTSEEEVDMHFYPFFIHSATMPALYGTMFAYLYNHPNTYLWFERGNTISVPYTEEHMPNIKFFSSQSRTTALSSYGYLEMRNTVRSIIANDPLAHFGFVGNDLTCSLILDVMVAGGVDFEDLEVVLISDGTGTYSYYAAITDEVYAQQKVNWPKWLALYEDETNRADEDFFVNFKTDTVNDSTGYNWQGTARGMEYYAFYLSTFPNVDLILQYPQYLKNERPAVKADYDAMNLSELQAYDLFMMMDEVTRDHYKLAIMAGALAYNGETYENDNGLTTLEDALDYFEEKFLEQTKPVVVITGTRDWDVAGYTQTTYNQPFIDQVIEYYTPTRDFVTSVYVNNDGEAYLDEAFTHAFDVNQGHLYPVGEEELIPSYPSSGTLLVKGYECPIEEPAAVFYFKPHPSGFPLTEFKAYLDSHDIEVLPRRTPAEILLWLYKDATFGGYSSSLFMSALPGQVGFFFGGLGAPLPLLAEAGFFDGAKYFTRPTV